MYFADSKGVAKSYKDNLSDGNALYSDVMQEAINYIGKKPKGISWFDKKGVEYGVDLDNIHEFAGYIRNGAINVDDLPLELKKIFDKSKMKGSLYKADLPDEWLPKMLDWDKPLSQQPKNVKEAFEKANVFSQAPKPFTDSLVENSTGRLFDPNEKIGTWFISNFTKQKDKEFAELMSGLGVPGIRYLDGNSRNAGQGTYNYVVFPGLEDQVKILSRE